MSAVIETSRSVMRGLVPRIHAFLQEPQDVDGRAMPGHDELNGVLA
jgi:hypothetical protein